MKFALVVCTYLRPKPLLTLLESVNQQTLYPDEIIVVDGSTNDETAKVLNDQNFSNLKYFLVEEPHRGLTRQRNFGIEKVSNEIEIVCFLDDDVVLSSNYFENLITTYAQKEDAIAVGGYITNEVQWEPMGLTCAKNKFCMDGWQRAEPMKFKIRKFLGLLPDTPPGILCSFSHGRSVSFLPPSGKIYKVEQFMGGVSSYKKYVLKKVSFSTYFEGYGLYEDVDYCVRILKYGKLYVNTAATLSHYHEPAGRPNRFSYGKMVVRNGWYVWRLKNENPSFKSKFKWHIISLLQAVLRFLNIFNTNEPFKALSDSVGRVCGWTTLWFNKPKILR